MRLDIIGCAGSYPAPATACSSYLVRSRETSILLDTGNGSQSRLFGIIDPSLISAIVISHAHLDHFADLIGFYHYLKYANPPQMPIPVFSTDDLFGKLANLLGSPADPSVFSLTPVSPGDVVEIQSITLEFFKGAHPVPTLVTRIADQVSSMCYGADGDVSEPLLEAAAGSDLLLAECTWVKRQAGFPRGLHLDAQGLAYVANHAKPRKLIITHIAYPGDKQQTLYEVSRTFRGSSSLASDGDTFDF